MAKENKKAALSLEERLDAALVPDWEQPYKVPANWCWTSIGAINKYSGSSVDPLGKPETIFELYSVPSSAEDYPEIIKGKEIGSTKQSVKKGDVLLCKINPRINRVWYVAQHTENPLIASSEWIIVRNEQIDSKYLMWCMRSEYFRDYMLSNVSGVGGSLMRAQPKYVQGYPIPLPPLAEQQRIVDRIESLFAKLDEAKEKAQEVVDGYDARRAAILHKAFSGELTADWRSISNIPISSWNRYKYGELGTSKLGKMLDQEKNTGRSIPYLRNVNVRWFTFDLQDVSTMLASETEIENLSVKNGDLFICEGGEPGRCAVWREQDAEMIFQKALHRFRPNEKVISEYLCYYLFYLSLNQSLNKFFTGTTIKHLTGKALAEIEVIVPSVDEQAQIVNRLQHLFDTEQMAKGAAEQAIIRIDNLKKSILARAFRGELETNDPTDESAVELLKDILGRNKTNKEEAKPVKKKVSVPAEIDGKLDTAMERDIVKLFYKADTTDIPIRQIMSISSKKFELMDALRALEKKAILKKNETGSYSLVKQE